MFDRIAPTYDLLNRVLSAGIDKKWRRFLVSHFPDHPFRLRYLDVATGTGDQIFAALEHAPDRLQSVTGVDLAEKMLARASHKPIPQNNGGVSVDWKVGSAVELPFEDGAFDVVSISFGIRNVAEPERALTEFRRVLADGGRALVLEFSMPKNPLIRRAYLLYFRNLLPLVGGWVSGQTAAYRYLNRTVEEFPHGEDFLALLREAGFTTCRAIPLTFGIATLYIANVAEKSS